MGDVQLIDQPGGANLIKPLGLFFPLLMALIAWALTRLDHRWQGIVVLVASTAWPVAHIGNLPAIAVPVDIALVVAFGSLVWTRRDVPSSVGSSPERGAVCATSADGLVQFAQTSHHDRWHAMPI